MNKIFIAAGGTGGHIYPALALADEIRSRYPECRIVFTGSDDRMEKELIPSQGYEYMPMHMGILKGSAVKKAAAAVSYISAEEKMHRILKKEKPDACIGFGNYISIPLILAAERLHIPTMIHEQNSFAGRANTFLAGRCDSIVCCYEHTIQQFPAARTRLLGNPAASAAGKTIIDRTLPEQYGIDPDRPFVLFMMGSLGSDSVCRVIDQAIPLFKEDLQVLIVTGKAVEYRFGNADRPNIHIVEYVQGAQMLSQAALAVTRAGATTISEITVLGTPAVLIPSPYVPNNHQVYNAAELADRQAAVMIEESRLDEKVLAETINRLMDDEEQRQQLGSNAAALGRPNAAADMLDWLEEIIAHE